jgi:hypothetical protein
MATSRYVRDPMLGLGYQYGTATATARIRSAITAGTLAYKEIVIRGLDRLDTIAGAEYGDGRYWWIIAAASNIGWACQVPAGTILKLPRIEDALALLG